MNEIVQALKTNSKVAIGAAGGYFLSGTAIGYVNKAASAAFSGVAGKWLSVASGVIVAGGAAACSAAAAACCSCERRSCGTSQRRRNCSRPPERM